MTEYRNSDGQVITGQEFNKLKGGTIETYNDKTGRLKKRENIILITKLGVTRTWHEYYLDASESETDIIRQFTDGAGNHTLTIYKHQQAAFGFEMWEAKDYNKDGILKFRSTIVYDHQRRIVSKINFDLQTSEVLRHSAYSSVKYYYGTAEDAQGGLAGLELRFTYEFDEFTDQFVTYIKDVHETTGEIHTMNVDECIELLGQDFWNAHPFYHSLFPVLPESPVI